MSFSEYPYNNIPSPNSPSFVISVAQPPEYKWGKKLLFVFIIIFIMVSFGVIFRITQSRQSVAEIRNFAYEEKVIPASGFGSLQGNKKGTPTPTPTPTLKPRSTFTPTPTQRERPPASSPTPIPLLSCQRVELFRGTENVTQRVGNITHGDTIRFIGYATNTGRPVKSLTFRLMIDDQERQIYESPATLSNNAWVAQYEYAFLTYGKHKVTVIGVTPE